MHLLDIWVHETNKQTIFKKIKNSCYHLLPELLIVARSLCCHSTIIIMCLSLMIFKYIIKFKYQLLMQADFFYINHYLDRYSPYFYSDHQAALRIYFFFFKNPSFHRIAGLCEETDAHSLQEPSGNPFCPFGRWLYIHRWNSYVLLPAMQRYSLFCHCLKVQG